MTNFISVITVRIMGEVLVEEVTNTTTKKKKVRFKAENIAVNSSLSSTIYAITLLLAFSMYIPAQWFNIVNIPTLIL